MKPSTTISGLDLAFGPRNLQSLMPKNVPSEFECGRSTQGNKFFTDLFYYGINTSELIPVDGIDKHQALNHIQSISRSFEPKHKHKEAACAYLFSIWFKPESTWTCLKNDQ